MKYRIIRTSELALSTSLQFGAFSRKTYIWSWYICLSFLLTICTSICNLPVY